MPYHIGAKGSYGCSGYPAVKDTGEVMGCHTTRTAAAAQIYAINRSEGNIGKAAPSVGDFVVFSMYDELKVGRVEFIMDQPGWLGLEDSEYAVETKDGQVGVLVRVYEEDDGVWEEAAELYTLKLSELVRIDSLMVERDVVTEETGGALSPIMSEEMAMMDKAYEGCGCPTCKALNVNCENCPVCQANEMKSNCCSDLNKQAPCWDGYVMRGMKPGEGGRMVPNCVPAAKADDLFEDDDSVVYETDTVSKAEGYSPPAGARAAAKRAIRWKEQGKATGAGTAVGWTRAGQLARGETLSLSTVKRMYSYFSRHQVDKKGKDFYNTSNPSNGRIMWDAWGGDAGFSWSRRIVERESDKALFSDFGKTVSRTTRLTEVFKRDYSTSARQRMAESGEAMPDGSFPIANETDLRNAIQSVGRASNYEAAKRHIVRRARALGMTRMLPESWR